MRTWLKNKFFPYYEIQSHSIGHRRHGPPLDRRNHPFGKRAQNYLRFSRRSSALPLSTAIPVGESDKTWPSSLTMRIATIFGSFFATPSTEVLAASVRASARLPSGAQARKCLAIHWPSRFHVPIRSDEA